MSKQPNHIFELSEEETAQPSTSRHAHDSSRPSTSKQISRRHSDTPPSSSSIRKRKHHVNPVVPTKYSMHDLFGTDSEDEEPEKHVNNRDAVRKDQSSHHGAAKKSKKNVSNADDARTTPNSYKRTSASELFGTDSDEDQAIAAKSGKKPAPPITSYFTKRIANGISRQSDPNKIGTHFIEVKVYNCHEIRNVQPMNRWRHAIITVKNQTNENTEAWGHLTQFIKATRNEFKDCRPDIISGCTTSYA